MFPDLGAEADVGAASVEPESAYVRLTMSEPFRGQWYIRYVHSIDIETDLPFSIREIASYLTNEQYLWRKFRYYPVPPVDNMDYSDYVKSFCPHCHFDPNWNPKTTYWYFWYTTNFCFRHRTAADAVAALRESKDKEVWIMMDRETPARGATRWEWRYPYAIVELGFKMGNGWAVSIDPGKAVVRRPSGTTFTYRDHDNEDGRNVSSYLYILTNMWDYVRRMFTVLQYDVRVSGPGEAREE